jgi:hypothetical protein
MPNIVYVLTNAAMPGIIKIGQTTQADINSRLTQLYTTGVPVPFTLEFACRVENNTEVESALHTAFGPYRVNPKREFFRIDPEQAIAILKLLHEAEDATSEVANQVVGIDQQSIQAAEQMIARRPNLNFEEMGIPIGSVLDSTRTDATVTVIGIKKVRYNDQEMSLTAATRLVMAVGHDLAPGAYWAFKGKTLRDIYEETYGEDR